MPLSKSHLSVITRHADFELVRIQNIIEHKVLVDGRWDLEEMLGRLTTTRADDDIAPKTLDLIGHSTPGQSLLMLGDWVLDAAAPTVTSFFRGLADNDVLPRLGVHTVRLLGCQTAGTDLGRATICALADILQLEVQGTTQLIYSAHYGVTGFRDDCLHTLVGSSDLRGQPRSPRTTITGERYRRVLDIETLPSSPIAKHEAPWPRRVAGNEAARSILRLIRRNDGAQMPGLLATPDCEVALPAMKPNWFHFAQVLLEGEFVRVYPDGNRQAGVLFPVEDPQALRSLVECLPIVSS